MPLVGYFDCPFKPWLYRVFYWAEFTLLPASWPLLVKGRQMAAQIINLFSRQPAL